MKQRGLYRGRVATFALLILTATLCPPAANGQEWSRFRGPNGTGISDAPCPYVNWSEDDYAWRVKIPPGHSSPVLWGDRIFITGADDDDATRLVLCIDAKTGKTLWQKEHSSESYQHHKFNSFASETPAIDARHVYCIFLTPAQLLVLAMDHDGDEIWRRDLGPFDSQHGGGMSPMVVGDKVIVSNVQQQDGFIIALDAETGETKWKLPRKPMAQSAAYATPCLRRTANGEMELIALSTAHGFTGIDPDTGEVNWELPGVFEKRVVGSPVLAGELIIGTNGSGGGGNYVVAVRPGDGADVEPSVAYEIRKNAAYVPTLLAKDELLFMISDKGFASCIDAKTGDIIWQERLGEEFFASPIWAEEKLYCVSRDGTMFVLNAGREFKVLSRIDLGEPSNATPAFPDGVMYIRTHTHLMRLGGK